MLHPQDRGPPSTKKPPPTTQLLRGSRRYLFVPAGVRLSASRSIPMTLIEAVQATIRRLHYSPRTEEGEPARSVSAYRIAEPRRGPSPASGQDSRDEGILVKLAPSLGAGAMGPGAAGSPGGARGDARGRYRSLVGEAAAARRRGQPPSSPASARLLRRAWCSEREMTARFGECDPRDERGR
jgi:hypothetical protein